MKRKSVHLIVASLMALATQAVVADDAGQQLGTDVWKASGGENWSKVKQMHFTFVVEGDGNTLASVEHDWNVAAGTDHIKYKDKEVTVNLASPPQQGPGKVGYGRWVNDAYWLLAPLKLRDPGVNLQAEGKKDVDGATFDTLRVSFDKVGLTPTDQYVLYIDPQSKLVRAWDYIPSGGETVHGTWDKYQNFGGLMLATEHNFGGKTIRFTGVEVATK
jgi:hypothetical protein